MDAVVPLERLPSELIEIRAAIERGKIRRPTRRARGKPLKKRRKPT
jgi:hypothetical protein